MGPDLEIDLKSADFGLRFIKAKRLYATKQPGTKDITPQVKVSFSIIESHKILDKVKYFVYDGEMNIDQEIIDRVRSFNRFYTNIIGLLDQHFLDSPFSLTEGRVLYEICNTEECSAKKIREKIVIDEGYLSRILDSFSKRGLIRKTPSSKDGRLRIIVPTEKGKQEFVQLNENSNILVSQLIDKLSDEERADLLNKMEGIRILLEKVK